MSDDKKKTHVDSWFLSMDEEYEVDYFIRDMLQEIPGSTREDVLNALESCVKQISPSEGRAKIKACVTSKLTPKSPPLQGRDDRPKHPDRTHA